MQDDVGWRRRVTGVTLWLVAAAISVLANAELFMLLAHRDRDVAGSSPSDPATVVVELPAVETTPAPPTRPEAAPEASPDPPRIEPEAETASRDPDIPSPPDATMPPDDTPPDTPRSLPTKGSQPWRIAPLPVPRPHSRRSDPVRHTIVRLVPRSIVHAAASRVPAGSQAGEARRAAASAFAGAASTADWKSQVVAALNRVKRYPDGADAVGSPTIRMMVAASGDVARVAIVTSSGSDVLDTAAIETVRRTSPLPPPPGGPTGLTFRMKFHLRSP